MEIIIFGNKLRNEVAQYTNTLLRLLKNRDCITVYAEKEFSDFLDKQEVNTSSIKKIESCDNISADFAFSIGGDGTFLKSAKKLARKDIPLIGINAGRLGFLADVDGNEIEETINSLFNGKYKIEERSWLKLCTDNKNYNGFNYALNEIAVLKQDSSAMITVHAWINGTFLNTYQADGLLVATSTGSTAYSMSVGGPIVVPQADNFIITAVAPHSLNIRPLIIPDEYEIELEVESRNGNFLIALDGRNNVFKEKTKLKIKKASFKAKTIRFDNHDFYSILRSKLMWGSGTRK